MTLLIRNKWVLFFVENNASIFNDISRIIDRSCVFGSNERWQGGQQRGLRDGKVHGVGYR